MRKLEVNPISPTFFDNRVIAASLTTVLGVGTLVRGATAFVRAVIDGVSWGSYNVYNVEEVVEWD